MVITSYKKVEPKSDSILPVGPRLPICKILKNKPHLFGNTYSIGKLGFVIRTNVRELSRFTETDKRKLAFFPIKNRCPDFQQNSGAKIQNYLMFTAGFS